MCECADDKSYKIAESFRRADSRPPRRVSRNFRAMTLALHVLAKIYELGQVKARKRRKDAEGEERRLIVTYDVVKSARTTGRLSGRNYATTTTTMTSRVGCQARCNEISAILHKLRAIKGANRPRKTLAREKEDETARCARLIKK